MWLSWQRHAECFHFSNHPACCVFPSLLPLPPPPPSPTGNPDPFTVSMVFPFPKCHKGGSSWYITSSEWLLLLSNIQLRFLQIFFYGSIAHFFKSLNIVPWSGCAAVYGSIHLLRAFLLLPSLGSCQESCYKRPCVGFWEAVKFSALFGKYQEYDFWVVK